MGRKVLDKTLSAAAALLGRKGGSRNTEAQRKARSASGKVNVNLAHAAIAAMPKEDLRKKWSEAQKALPATELKSRAAIAVNARWAKREKPDMGNDEFRELVGAFTAKEIAEGVGVSYAKVLTWRRKANPIPIKNTDAARVREWVKAQKK